MGQENGEYFADGSDILKAADFEQIEIDVKLENKSDKAMHFAETGWKASLKDGYEFENLSSTGKIDEQLPSHYTGKGKLIILKEKDIKVDTLFLTYNLLDYNEEWGKAVFDAISGELTEQEYKEKFTPQPMEFELKIK